MKYCFLLLIVFYGTVFNKINSIDKTNEPFIPNFFLSQQTPFYFIKPVPATIKLFGNIDLSFFRNQSMVYQYRYRLEVPNGAETAIDRNLIKWSAWINIDFNEIKIPLLDQEGGYKLVIEYIIPKINETKKFEKLFYVYKVNPTANSVFDKSKTAPVKTGTVMKIPPVTSKTVTKTPPVSGKTGMKTPPVTGKAMIKTEPVIDKTSNKITKKPVLAIENATKEKVTGNMENMDLENKIINRNAALKTLPLAGNIAPEPSEKRVIIEKSIVPDYDKLLAVAIEKKDTVMFYESIQHEAGTALKGKYGGNIFHLLDDNFASEGMISMLKKKGFSINEADNYGNSPLHYAILTGEFRYANSLMNQGADLNLKNQMELSPLHLAALLNDKEIVNSLVNKGAEINMKGNTGYTPLHIASEMNYIEIAKNLLENGAKKGIKTDQKLSPKAIAKIQNNHDMVKLIRGKSSYSINMSKSKAANTVTHLNFYENQDLRIDFNLQYDKKLVKKRQFNKVIQIISIPAFALSGAGISYMKSKADHYYSLSKIAETEDMAKVFYDKSTKYYAYTYISVGISLVSAYGFIHSTLRKKGISNKMYKTFN